jgi:metal-responsive CopG/Arc/MetJ family transcriptional regulator
MTRTRVSTTVDQELLRKAREVCEAKTDSALIDEALRALLARHRSTEVDGRYKAYDEHPVEEADDWGDLASFREAAGSS